MSNEEENDKKDKLELAKLQSKIKSFDGLLDEIENLGDKKKSLWKEIYENAVTDRANAYTLFVELHTHVRGDPTQHAIQGPQLAKYLERMGKCTDQLIRLVELITEAELASQGVNPDEIYDRSKRFG